MDPIVLVVSDTGPTNASKEDFELQMQMEEDEVEEGPRNKKRRIWTWFFLLSFFFFLQTCNWRFQCEPVSPELSHLHARSGYVSFWLLMILLLLIFFFS
jgi:polyferredoxin